MKYTLVLLAGLSLLTGCATAPSPWKETVTQVSTYEALKAGRYDGQMAVSNLLEYGDTGLGTYEGLNGEMVVVSGVVYQVTYDGAVAEAPLEVRVPFACVTWFEPDITVDSGSMTYKVFQNAMNWKNKQPDYVQAVRIRGTFKKIKFRSVPEQQKPYPPLDSVVAAHQQTWEREGVEGVLVGFYFPPGFSALAPAGYHLHFLSSDRLAGGHVLDFELAVGRIEMDATPAVQIFLPPPVSKKQP